jgi:hypothetical protein
MEETAFRVIAYAAIAAIAVRVAVVALAIPVVWGSGLYMMIRMIAKQIRQGVRR